jgi:hypothetical protein
VASLIDLLVVVTFSDRQKGHKGRVGVVASADIGAALIVKTSFSARELQCAM